VSVLPITNPDSRTTERSTSGSLGDVSWIQKAASQLYRRNVPLLHMCVHPTPRYVIAHDRFYQPFPRVSTESDKHLGEKAWVRGYLNDASFSTTSFCSVPFVCVC